MKEIELKYRVFELPNIQLASLESKVIKQGYLAIAEDFSREVRVRSVEDRAGHHFYLTLKKGKDKTERDEFETEISSDEFLEWWPDTLTRRVEKIRYLIPFNGKVIELDVYDGTLSGLITAEVEFSSVEEAGLFQPPHWFDEDVTERREFKNAHLALHGLEELKNEA